MREDLGYKCICEAYFVGSSERSLVDLLLECTELPPSTFRAAHGGELLRGSPVVFQEWSIDSTLVAEAEALKRCLDFDHHQSQGRQHGIQR